MLDASARIHFGSIELTLLFNFYRQLSLFNLGYSSDVLYKPLLAYIKKKTEFCKANLLALFILLAVVVRLLL